MSAITENRMQSDGDGMPVSSASPTRAGCSECDFEPTTECQFDSAKYDPKEQWKKIKKDVVKKSAALKSQWNDHKRPKNNCDPILRLRLFLPLAFLTLAFFLALTWRAFIWEGMSKNGDITLPAVLSDTLPVASDPAILLILAVLFVGFLALLTILFAVRLFQLQAERKIRESIVAFFDCHLDQCWVAFLRQAASRIGASDRKDAKDVTANTCLCAMVLWRRLERFSSRSEASWSVFREEREKTRKGQLVGLVLIYPILYMVIRLFIENQALRNAAPIELYADYFKWLHLFLLLSILFSIFIYFTLRRFATATANDIEAALGNEDVTVVRDRRAGKHNNATVREMRFAQLDPTALIIDRYRSALDDLATIMT